MNLRSSSLLISFSLLTSATVFASTAPFSYRTLEPVADGVTCATSADSLAKRFAKATGLKVTGSSCEGTQSVGTATLNILVVNYQANGEAVPYKATFSGRSYEEKPFGDAGLFASYADCSAAVTQQKDIFAKNTGLKVVAAHCENTTDPVDLGFFLTLEGFGQPSKTLYSYAENQESTLMFLDPAVHAASVQVIQNAGGVVALTDATHTFYYNDSPIYAESSDLGLFDSSADCEKQKSDALAIYSNSGMDFVSVVCAKYYSSDVPQRALTVIGEGLPNLDQDFASHSAKYASYADCLTDKPLVIQNHVSEGEKVLGGICRPDEGSVNGQYVIEIYRNN